MKVSVVLSGGVVQSIYSDIEDHVDIDIYDLDDYENDDEAFDRIDADNLSPIW